MSDFRIDASHLPAGTQALMPVFELFTAHGGGPLDRRLLRASLLIDGIPVADIIPPPMFRQDRKDYMRFEFSKNDYIPLGHLNSAVTLRLVTNDKLGGVYELYSYAFPCIAPADGIVFIHFVDAVESTYFIIDEHLRLQYRGPKILENLTWKPISKGHPTKPQRPSPSPTAAVLQQAAAQTLAPTSALDTSKLAAITSLLSKAAPQQQGQFESYGATFAPYSPTSNYEVKM